MESKCFYHEAAPAVSRCILCLKPLCGSCMLRTPDGGVFCSDECIEKYNRSQTNATAYKNKEEEFENKHRQDRLMATVKSILFWAILISVLIAVWVFMPTGTKKLIFREIDLILRSYGLRH